MIPDSAIAGQSGEQRVGEERARHPRTGELSGRWAAPSRGQTNNNGNDGTIARFGWKAQNKSLLIFSGEAYNVEMGITNELFPTEREETPECQFTPHPNSVSNLEATKRVEHDQRDREVHRLHAIQRASDAVDEHAGGTPSIAAGRALVHDHGCAFCHTPSFKTGNSSVAALANQDVNLFSDLMTHDMGVGLADGISQGEAGPREFRTAPLWGLGQRIFFLHDGRTSDLITAIGAHQSNGSEANAVINRWNNLTETQQQNLLNFLRSL